MFVNFSSGKNIDNHEKNGYNLPVNKDVCC